MEHQSSRSALSVLSLGIDLDGDDPDRPTVAIKVDGQSPFSAVAADWRGFDPLEVFGPTDPLLPISSGRRVAVCRCACGEPGCGVIAPLIAHSADGTRVSWLDSRDYVGVFNAPTAEVTDMDTSESRRWKLSDLHFDRRQYEAEVVRAGSDRSWETPRRALARLVDQRLREISLELPPNRTLQWVRPAWRADGVELSFESRTRVHEEWSPQQLLHLTSPYADAERAADDVVDRLVRTPPEDRAREFARHEPYR